MTFLSRMHQLRTPWMAWWLALALVVAPALGRMHEVLHAPVLPHTQAQPGDEAGHALFAEHSALECLAFDQLNLGCDQPLPLALHPPWPAACCSGLVPGSRCMACGSRGL